MFAHVAIPKSAPDALTYRVPDELLAVCGARRSGAGADQKRPSPPASSWVSAAAVDIPVESIRPIEEVLDEAPLLPQRLMDIAEFISGYYRCPLGTTLASMIPARLFRPDAEEVRLTPTGRRHRPAGSSATPSARFSPFSRKPLVSRSRPCSLAPVFQDAAPSTPWPTPAGSDFTDGGAIARLGSRSWPSHLPDESLADLLERCSRAPRQRQVLEWLSSESRPALASEVTAATGCSAATLRTMVDRGLLNRFSQRTPQRPRWSLRGTAARHTLTDEQAVAVDAVNTAVSSGGYAPFLLHGVTGSGKTEVYIRCLETVLAAGRGGIVLVPEIGLTPAASGAVEQRFGRAVAVLHSAQSDGDRWREWSRLRAGEARIVVGPRSALFAPIENLGLIVVDEEQDSAYKQQEAPRYHARDLALVLGRDAGVPVLLCSATPSAEASGLVQRGLAAKLVLSRRVAGNPLPEVELVDLRQQKPEPGEQGRTLFSQPLKDALAETIGRGEQAILLIQRRGWAPVLMCRDCGHRIDCPSCSVAMVVHRRSGDLRCHYCSHQQTHPLDLPVLQRSAARSRRRRHREGGPLPGRSSTPMSRSVILDRDTVRRRDGLERALGTFAEGDAQVLVGTQMVAKGHHFPDVTLTGVISADALLNLPDFRSGERTFQLLTQVAGRAGRGDRPGRVIIQTYYPDHPAVRFACHHDVDAFLEEELVFRRAFAYPPAARLALVRFESRNQNSARRAAEEAAHALGAIPDGVTGRGPAPAPIERIREYWRWQILISARNRDTACAIFSNGRSPRRSRSRFGGSSMSIH